jgi:hypothetical protein
MKTAVKKSDEFFVGSSQPIATLDYKSPPHEVLKGVDDLLAVFGLEVWLFEAEGDEYEFTIGPRGRLTHAELDGFAKNGL